MYVRNSDMYVRHRKGSNARRIINNNNLLVRPHIGYGSNTGAASYSDYYQPHYGQGHYKTYGQDGCNTYGHGGYNYGQSYSNNHYGYSLAELQGGGPYQGDGGGRNWQHGGGQGVDHSQYGGGYGGGGNLAHEPHLQQGIVGSQRCEDGPRHGSSSRRDVGAQQQRVVSQQHGNRGRLHRGAARPYTKAKTTAMHRTVRGPAPVCNLCSYQQRPPARKKEVRHHHFSSRQVRILAE